MTTKDIRYWLEDYKFILITKTKGFKEIFRTQNVYVYEVD